MSSIGTAQVSREYFVRELLTVATIPDTPVRLEIIEVVPLETLNTGW